MRWTPKRIIKSTGRLSKKSNAMNVKLFKSLRKIVKSVKLSLQATFVKYVSFLTMTGSAKRFFIVMDVAYVVLEEEKTFFIVTHVSVVSQLVKKDRILACKVS